MAPKITIVIFIFVGWFFGGVWGAIAGGIFGSALAFVIGLVAVKASGGLLPAKARRNLAIEFLSDYPELMNNQHTQSMSAEEKLSYIESQIERVAKQALMASPGYEITTGGLSQAGERTIAQEPDATLHPMLKQLSTFMMNKTPWDVEMS